MGYQNQALVRLTAKRYRLTNVEEKVLDHIALTSLDEVPDDPRPPRLYWAGWVALAERLGLADPTSPNARKYVGRILRSLAAKGALEHVVTGRRGHRAAWRLAVTLTPPTPVDNTRKGGQGVLPNDERKGGQGVLPKSVVREDKASSIGRTRRPPLGIKRINGDEESTRVSPNVTSDSTPVDNPPAISPAVAAGLAMMEARRKAKGGR